MQWGDRDGYVKESTWATLPAVLLGLGAMFLLVYHQYTLGYLLVACGLFGAWLCDFTTLSVGLLADITTVATGVVILSLSDLAADLSNLGMLRYLMQDLPGASAALQEGLLAARQLGHARLECPA